MNRFEELFWRKIRRGTDSECWPWVGYRKPSGHGLTQLDNMPIHAHRKAWILTHGPIRDGLCVNHRCDNAACCNPSHLYLGTRADNMIDMWTKRPPDSRSAVGRRFVLTDEQILKLWELRSQGVTLRACANKFGVHIATICRYITEARRLRLAQLRAARLSRLSR